MSVKEAETYEAHLTLELSLNSILFSLKGFHESTSVAFRIVVSQEYFLWRFVF